MGLNSRGPTQLTADDQKTLIMRAQKREIDGQRNRLKSAARRSVVGARNPPIRSILGERNMKKSVCAAVLFSALAAGGVAAQGVLLDAEADKVIKKFTTASCEELKAQKTEAPSEKEKMAIDFLKNDSRARKAFIDKIAPTVMNKMLECGTIP